MKKNMNSVYNGGNGRFIINDSIVVFDLSVASAGIEYSVDYDETIVTGEEAIEIAEDFIKKTLAGVLNNENEEEIQDVYVPQQ